MSDQQEEQEMEAEALTAIFDSHFSIIQGDCMPFVWKIVLWPEQQQQQDDQGDNHVGIELQVTLPTSYPDTGLPECHIDILKGLTGEHVSILLQLAQEEAEANAGIPCVFAICERLREWLVENNQKGHDDISMHAQMLRRKAEQEKKQIQQTVRSYGVLGQGEESFIVSKQRTRIHITA
jgi:RWD domain